MRSRPFLAVLVATLFVTAGCLGATPAPVGTAGAQGTTAPSDNTTVSVSATGQTSLDPDLAVVRVAVVATAPDADAARELLAENVTRMRDALRVAGVPDDNVTTTSLSLQSLYDFERDSRTLRGYRAVHAFEVETAVDSAGSVVDTAVSNGANRVDGVQFTLAEETRREARADALRDAMANARADAETLGDTEGVAVVGVSSIATSDVVFRPFDAAIERGGVADGAPTVVEAGPVTVSATVQVTYLAE